MSHSLVKLLLLCSAAATNGWGSSGYTDDDDDGSSSAQTTTTAVALEIDFDEPRYGAVCYRAQVGDVLRFVWDENHNLWELPDRASYDACSFGSATNLVDAGPQPSGLSVTVTSASEQFFACSKICASNDHKVHICVDSTLCDASCRNITGTSFVSTSTSAMTSGSSTDALVVVGIVAGVVVGMLLLLCWARWYGILRCCEAAPPARAAPGPAKCAA